jgi:hypothetical protein
LCSKGSVGNMAPLSYAHFDHIDDEDEDDSAEQRAAEQKHSKSMRIIAKLLQRADPDVRAL